MSPVRNAQRFLPVAASSAYRLSSLLPVGGLLVDELVDRVGHPAGPGEQERRVSRLAVGRGGHPVEQVGHGRPLIRLLRQAGRHDLPQRGRQGVKVGRFVHRPEVQGVGSAGAERADTDGGVRQHRAEREDITGGPDGPTGELLRGHETGRADRHPGVSERAGLTREGDPEVDHPGAVRGQQHVGGLEITMDDARVVDRLQRLRQPRAERQYGPGRPRPVPGDRLPERHTGHVDGRQPGRRTVGVGVDDTGGEGPVHPAGRRHLTGETPPEVPVPRQLRTHHLHRDRTPTGRTPQIHLAHAARTDPRHDPVPPHLPRVLRLQDVEHGPSLRTPQTTPATDSASCQKGSSRERERTVLTAPRCRPPGRATPPRGLFGRMMPYFWYLISSAGKD